jgi:hypothetical protein
MKLEVIAFSRKINAPRKRKFILTWANRRAGATDSDWPPEAAEYKNKTSGGPHGLSSRIPESRIGEVPRHNRSCDQRNPVTLRAGRVPHAKN